MTANTPSSVFPVRSSTKSLQPVSIEDYWNILRKHRRLSITFFVAVVLSTCFYTLTQPKIYEAATTVLIEQGNPNVVSFQDVFSVTTQGRDYYPTQYELIKSRSVAKLVMDHLGLWPQYGWTKDPVGAFVKQIKVDPVKDSRLVQVIGSSTDPELAANIANATVRFYVEQVLENKTTLSQRAADWLEGKIKGVRDKLAKSEMQFGAVKLKKELVELDERYLPKHPKMIRARERLEVLESQLGEAIQDVESGNLPVLYNQLEREVQSNRRVYEQMLSRLKETIAREGVEETNVFVVDSAEAPIYHSRPRMSRNLLVAVVIGIFGALGLSLVFESLDHTIKTPEEIEQLTELPVLGTLPHWDTKKKELIVAQDRLSGEAEAFRAIRTSLLFSSPDKPIRALLITSPHPEEGKSIVASNLALTIAQSGARVLLVDADLRKPRLGTVFSRSQERGLADALTKANSPLGFIQNTNFENLSLLTSGPLPPMSSELVGSQKMRDFVAQWKEQFDYVLVDAPPFLSLTDSVILGSILDGVIAVVRYHRTPKEVLSRLSQKFAEVNARLLGIVLNAVNLKEEGYRYHEYSYGYGETRSTKKAARGGAQKFEPDTDLARLSANAKDRFPP